MGSSTRGRMDVLGLSKIHLFDKGVPEGRSGINLAKKQLRVEVGVIIVWEDLKRGKGRAGLYEGYGARWKEG